MEPHARDIATAVEHSYDVGAPVSCRFLLHGFNDHFRATASGVSYHVRLYLDGKYYIDGDDDLEFELRSTDALARAGCPVVRLVRRRDGGLLSIATVDGRQRRLAVFEVAAGSSAESIDTDTAVGLGRIVADIHAAADRVAPSGRRYHLDEQYLLRQPLFELRRLLGDTPDVEALTARAAALGEVLARIPRTAPDYGLIHGDLHFGNLLFAADQTVTVLDFDHCAFGWRAYDLAPLRMALPSDKWQALLAGYRDRRPLPAGSEFIDDALVSVRRLWDVGDMLAMQTTWGDTSVGDDIVAELPNLMRRFGLAPGEPSDRSRGA